MKAKSENWLSEAHRLASNLGKEEMQLALGLSQFSIKRALEKRAFPSSWYAPLKALGRRKGVKVPLSAFSWIDNGKKFGQGQEKVNDTVNRSA